MMESDDISDMLAATASWVGFVSLDEHSQNTHLLILSLEPINR